MRELREALLERAGVPRHLLERLDDRRLALLFELSRLPLPRLERLWQKIKNSS